MQERSHIYKRFSSSFRNAFPQFNNKDYKMTALRKYFIKVTPLHIEILPWCLQFIGPSVLFGADILIIDPSSSHCFEVVQLIRAYKKTCNKAEGAILLKIEQRRRSQEPSVTNALTEYDYCLSGVQWQHHGHLIPMCRMRRLQHVLPLCHLWKTYPTYRHPQHRFRGNLWL